jgi:aryl-alcohol dehydrogenase-like predicted oxidoreductase
MEYRQLGASDLKVSALCLGTMTFGEQNSEADAHAQLDLAVSRGVNFIDAAEMYPVPPRAETQGLTESYIGSWLKHQRREELIVATKIAGPSRGFAWIRNGPHINREHITSAIDDSLKRLQTEYIDLYQIHWPDRYVPMFGATSYDVAEEHESTPIAEQLQVMADMVKAGKIRHIGLSNETPWGVSEFAQCAEKMGLPKIITVQNAYHLMNRSFETGLAEVCHHTKVGLLAYSPLAFGHLTGKYLADPNAKGRITQFANFGQRYAGSRVNSGDDGAGLCTHPLVHKQRDTRGYESRSIKRKSGQCRSGAIGRSAGEDRGGTQVVSESGTLMQAVCHG